MRYFHWSGLRRRSVHALGIMVGLAVLSGVGSGAVQAQSFLQQLFGIGPQPQVQPIPRALPQRRSSDPVAERRIIRPVIGPVTGPGTQPASRESRRSVPQEGTGGYNTVCVRLCDGFYFPISHRASRGRFQHDVELCRSRCGETESRLFYYSSSGGSMTDAIDLNGRSYTRLQNAFLHRKQLVAGCACKPQPWSEASLMRHQLYAMSEGRNFAGGGGVGTIDVVAGAYASGATAAVAPHVNGGGSVETDPRAPAAAPTTIATSAAAAVPVEDATGQKADAAATVVGAFSGATISSRAAARPVEVASGSRSGRGSSQRRKPRVEIVQHNETPRRVASARAVARPTTGQPVAAQQRQRVVAAPTRKPMRIASAPSAGAMMLGGGGMRWPGDPPR